MPKQLLPVGSVVRLEGADALVMVLGFEPTVATDHADYLGVAYPQGLVSDDAALLFDAEAVSVVVHRGFWDEEGDAALAAVRNFRASVDDMERQIREFTATLTPERVIELHDEYLFDQMDEEPEPDFFDEGVQDGEEPSADAWQLADD